MFNFSSSKNFVFLGVRGKGLRSKVYQVHHNACFFYMKEGKCPVFCTRLNSFFFLKSTCKILDQSLNFFRTILINLKHGYSACTWTVEILQCNVIFAFYITTYYWGITFSHDQAVSLPSLLTASPRTASWVRT